MIIVDDGSKDRTSEIGLQYTNKFGSEKVDINDPVVGGVDFDVFFCNNGVIFLSLFFYISAFNILIDSADLEISFWF